MLGEASDSMLGPVKVKGKDEWLDRKVRECKGFLAKFSRVVRVSAIDARGLLQFPVMGLLVSLTHSFNDRELNLRSLVSEKAS